MITGGLGGSAAGRGVADRAGRSHLALIGRHAPVRPRPGDGAHGRAGAQVLALQADVGDTPSGGGHAAIDEQLPEIRGIFHSAGVLDDGALARLSWDRFETSSHRRSAVPATSPRAPSISIWIILCCFVCRIAGVRPSGESRAANSYLARLRPPARSRTAGLSINWVAVRDRSGRDALRRRAHRNHGAALLSPDQGSGARHLDAQGRPQVGVIPIEWPVFLRQFAAAASPRLPRSHSSTRAEPPEWLPRGPRRPWCATDC